ncbi:hypothetical protein [Streptomyces sp. NBC_00576]|uniref:hypothetical protein n=1 Tax=Streptomyces sp. NBC_00576 TaxID=2903665 RepID=UPI002E81E45E|nr:hypothetical protein [Streptomyces sp. NBC_00576]WUB69936.1 hypothetical protein OG734_07560 [Streptomyces sp. NBC_00576]
MRRTARVLSVAALAGAALATTASAVSADAAGEVSPGSVGPGGTVTVSVACEATGGTPPASIDAHSQGFEQGTVQLQQVPGNDDQVTGPAYSGTAKIAPAGSFEGDQNANAPASEWSADGTCPGQAGAEGKAWKAPFTVTRDGTGTGTCGTDSHGDAPQSSGFQDWSSCPTNLPTAIPTHAPLPTPAPVQRGVQAGQGGAFTDSVPALVAGGVLIAGAAGAAVHRLRRRGTSARR